MEIRDKDSSWDTHRATVLFPNIDKFKFVAKRVLFSLFQMCKGIMRISDQVACVRWPGVPGNCPGSIQQSAKESGTGVTRSQDEPPCLQDTPDLPPCLGGEERPVQSS